MVIPISTAICKRGFSKQKLIQSHLHTSLELEILDALMCNWCANILVENINWNAMMLVWRNMKDRRIHPLLWRVSSSLFLKFWTCLYILILIQLLSLPSIIIFDICKKVLNFVVDELMYASETSTSRLIFWLGISGLIALCLYSHVIYDIM
jgi:hypothetical protein